MGITSSTCCNSSNNPAAFDLNEGVGQSSTLPRPSLPAANQQPAVSASHPAGSARQHALLAQYNTSSSSRSPIKPSQYQPWDVSVTEIEVPSQALDFGTDLKGGPLSSRPLKAYRAAVRPPSSEEGTSGIFYQVDPETFVRARDRALAAQGDYASDVLPRTASALEEMGAKLYLNETGSGGIATHKLGDDGRTEAISGFNLPKGAEGRGDLDLTRRGVMKLDGVNVAECMKSLAAARLKLYGYKTVATLPLEKRMPAFWPEAKPKDPIHSLVKIPSRPPSPNTLDKEAVECTTEEQFYEAGRQAYLEMYKNYRLPAEQD